MAQRILIVDDNRESVRLVRAYLEQDDYQVLVAYDSETALQILRRERLDLVLLGPMGSGGEELEVIRVMRAVVHQPSPVGQEPGADDDASRPFTPDQVVARLQAILCSPQETLAPRQVIQAGRVSIDLDGRQVHVGGKPLHLTPTEFALLQALAEQPGHALTRLEMIELGLGYSYEGLERTVDSHIKNLRRKLDKAGGAAHLIETVFGIGYRLAAGDLSGEIAREEDGQAISASL